MTASQTDTLDIIAKLERASGPDRELDVLISVIRWRALFSRFPPRDVSTPAYTDSLEWALTLARELLPGSGFELFSQIGQPFYRATIFSFGGVQGVAEAPTAPRSVLAALFCAISGCEGSGAEETSG